MENNVNKKNPLNDLMSTTLEKVREMADTNTIVGEPIVTPDGVTLIPVSKISFGFGSGGGSYGKNPNQDKFGGGSGAGISVIPQAFLVVNGTDVKLLQISTSTSAADKAVNMIPEVIDMIGGLIKKDKASEDSTEQK